MKGKPVICNETQEIYNSISAAEKSLNFKLGSLSNYIKNKEIIDGHTYSYYDENYKFEKYPVIQEEINDSEIMQDVDTNQIERNEPEKHLEIDIYELRDLAYKLRLRGYDCIELDNQLVFFGIKQKSDEEIVKKTLIQERYSGRYKLVPCNSERYLNTLI